VAASDGFIPSDDTIDEFFARSKRRTTARSEQQLRQPMPRAQLILLCRFPLTDEIVQCF
jgi:hypothetical protein